MGKIRTLILLTAFALCLSGCGKKEAEQEVKWDLRPMVMVDGKIYLDTGEMSYMTYRCGVMDGEITSEVDGSEKPTENDQSNFGTGYGYQRVDEYTIELFIDGNWIVFEREDKEDPWGITLSAENVTPSGMTLVITQAGGEAEGELEYGESYGLDVKKDGVWQDVETVIEDYGWNSVAYMLDKNESKETEINWEWLYGKLEKGEYRIAKGFMDFRGTGDYESRVYYAYFNIYE